MSTKEGKKLKLKLEKTNAPNVNVPSSLIDSQIDAKIVINDTTFECDPKDLVEEKELGRGAYGAVYQMRHIQTDCVMAVKRIRATVEKEERRRLLRELNVCMDSKHCPYTITFYGAMFGEGDVWICMEMMHRSLHEVYKLVYDKLHLRIPETVVGKMAESTLKALHFLKKDLKVLHRDVKPSNILINTDGEIKLCDFGIAGELVNSFVQTDIGCKPYLALLDTPALVLEVVIQAICLDGAGTIINHDKLSSGGDVEDHIKCELMPERINPSTTGGKYDQRSDVWSYGITMFELAVGRFPYPSWTNVFDQLKTVVEGDPPRISKEAGVSENFSDFVHLCLTHAVEQRPKFCTLMEHAFIKYIEVQEVDVAGWYGEILAKEHAPPANT